MPRRRSRGRLARPARFRAVTGPGQPAARRIPFPGTPDWTQICLRNGFDPGLLYQVVFTAQDPPVLGIGFAAFRDVASFFRNATEDEDGTPSPLANQITRVISRGRSQSGGFLRAFLQLGFNQDEGGRQVHDGMWPIIAGRRVSLNARFAQPDGALKLYEAGSEGPQWWASWQDTVRGLPAAGILDRCTASQTCPKIVEHFGAAEAWSLLLSPGLVGTTADSDIPLPSNVRRYYIPAHGMVGAGEASASRPSIRRRAQVRTSVAAPFRGIRFRIRRRSTRCGSTFATG